VQIMRKTFCVRCKIGHGSDARILSRNFSRHKDALSVSLYRRNRLILMVQSSSVIHCLVNALKNSKYFTCQISVFRIQKRERV